MLLRCGSMRYIRRKESERQARFYRMLLAGHLFSAEAQDDIHARVNAKPSASITAAGVVAIIGSVLTAFGISLGLLGVLLSSQLQAQPALTPMIRTMTTAFLFLCLAISIFGICAGIGLLRLKNWARISVLVWSGLTVVFCAMIILFFIFIPTPTPPNGVPGFSTIVHAFVILFYGLPFVIGVWWLILFNRSEIIRQFSPPVFAAEGFRSTAQVAERLKPQPPIPIIVLAVFLLIGPLGFAFIVLMRAPTILFGHVFRGSSSVVIALVLCVVSVAAAVGLLKLKRWGYSLTVGLQFLFLVSGIVTLLTPGFDAVMQNEIVAMMARMGQQPVGNVLQTAHASFRFGVAVPVAILVIAIYYRPKFLHAAAGVQGPPA
jgi:hypothetical protein